MSEAFPVKVIILAGGFGTRLQSVVKDLPKPMALVNGQPFLELLIRKLKGYGITDIVLSVGYMRDLICDYFGNGTVLGVTINYSAETSPLGTGGAIRTAMERFPAERYLVMNGDSLFDYDLDELLTFHQARHALLTIALAEVADKSRYGAVELDANGKITCFAEKGAAGDGLINAGVYLLEQQVREMFPAEVCSFEQDLLRPMVGDRLYGLPQQGFFIDIGLPEDYLRLNQLLKQTEYPVPV
jgi:D-glycero-alpha-D-manno-heptose 1-phosphate guanylyltransferase